MLAVKPGIPAKLLTIYPPLPPPPAGADPAMKQWYQSLSQWYDELKRVLQATSDSLSK